MIAFSRLYLGMVWLLLGMGSKIFQTSWKWESWWAVDGRCHREGRRGALRPKEDTLTPDSVAGDSLLSHRRPFNMCVSVRHFRLIEPPGIHLPWHIWNGRLQTTAIGKVVLSLTFSYPKVRKASSWGVNDKRLPLPTKNDPMTSLRILWIKECQLCS